jgi:hypothetical protein
MENMEETMEATEEISTFNIPAEYMHLKKTFAAAIMNIPVSSFYRKYIDTGIISLMEDAAGKERIPFSELVRVFGEQATNKLRQHLNSFPIPSNGKNGSSPDSLEEELEDLHSKIEKIRLEEKLKALQEKLFDRETWISDREKQLLERNQIIQEQREQIRLLEKKVYGLLENKTQQIETLSPEGLKQKEILKNLQEQVESLKQAQEKKGWIKRIFKI